MAIYNINVGQQRSPVFRFHLVIALLLLSAACAPTDTGKTSRSSNRVVVEPVGQARTLRLPFDNYTPSDSHEELIRRAVDTLTGRCLRHSGYSWPISPKIEMVDAPNRRRYGVIELEVARRAGYRPVSTSTAEKLRETINNQRSDKRPEAEVAAITACQKRSSAHVRSLAARSDMPQRIGWEIFELTRKNDPRVEKAFKMWRECMQENGLKGYNDPLEAVADPHWDGPQLGKNEIITAVTDVQCKQKAGVVAVWHKVETDRQEKAVNKDRAHFDRIRQALERERGIAQRVLDGS